MVVPPHSSSKRPSVKPPHLYHVTILASYACCDRPSPLQSRHTRVYYSTNATKRLRASAEGRKMKACSGIVGDRDISCRFLSTWGRCNRKSVKPNSKTGTATGVNPSHPSIPPFLSTWGRCDRKSVEQNSKTGVCAPCPGRDAILKIAVFVRWSISYCGRVLRNVFRGSGTAIGVNPSHPSIPPRHQAETRGSGIIFDDNLHVFTTS